MHENEQNTMKETFGEVIYAYTRAQAISDGVLIDVTETASEAGIKFPTALTSAVWVDYVAASEELKGQQDVMGRLWDILWLLACTVRSGRISGDMGAFEVIIAKPDKGDWKKQRNSARGKQNPQAGDAQSSMRAVR